MARRSNGSCINFSPLGIFPEIHITRCYGVTAYGKDWGTEIPTAAGISVVKIMFGVFVWLQDEAGCILN